MKRRTGWAALAVAVALLVVGGCSSTEPPEQKSAGILESTPDSDGDWRWVALRGVEVQVPAGWGFDQDAVRPDCIDPEHPQGDPWAQDVPRAPYVVVGASNRPVPMIGCLRKRRPGDPPRAFGELPFPLWQPLVRLERARPDLDHPARADGSWEYRGWHLTRETVDGVQIAVLAPPERPDLRDRVLTSVRRVETTSLGCEATSPVQAVRFTRPGSEPVPPAVHVEAVAVCEYQRIPGSPGLEGSRLITGREARALVEAIERAPRSGGPDRPKNCAADMYGERAIALRFFGSARDTTQPLAEAYVYYDWCFGNGIVDSAGARRLTRADCAPLFAEAPVLLWSGSTPVVDACAMWGRRYG